MPRAVRAVNPGMRTSDAGLRAIANEEGFVGHVYKDFAGVPTIGYGHALQPGETYTTLTEDEALELLRLDVAVAEGHVRRLVVVPLSQPQFDALVSFTFNLGGAALAGSTLLKLLNAGDYAGAAGQFERWCKARIRGQMLTSETLLARREREREMFESTNAAT